MNPAERTRAITQQCVNCRKLGDCGAEKQYRLVKDGVNCENFENKEETMDTRTKALLLVDEERNRQDSKWGEQNHLPPYWVSILGEEFGEYCEAVNETMFDNGPQAREKGGYDNMIKELSHIAAVAVGAMECLMRNGEAT